VRTTALTLEEGPPSEVSGTGLEQLEKQLNGQAEITVSDSNDPLDSVPAVLTEALVPGGRAGQRQRSHLEVIGRTLCVKYLYFTGEEVPTISR